MVLAEAYMNAVEAFALSREDMEEILGLNFDSVSMEGINPDSKQGETATSLVRCYMALYGLVGGELEAIRHWMNTPNEYTGGIPAEQIYSEQGLVIIVEYLERMRIGN